MAISHIPAELNQPTPRRVRTSRTFKIAVGLQMSVMVVMGVILTSVTWNADHDKQILRDSGVAAQARITDLVVQHGKSTSYHIKYQFQAPAPAGTGSLIEIASQTTTLPRFQQLHVGQSIPILYDPTRPTRSNLNFDDELHTTNPYADLVGMDGLGLVILVFTGISVGVPAFSYFKQKKILQTGAIAAATILKEESVSVGRSKGTAVTYRFVDDRGQTIETTKKLPIKSFRKFAEKVEPGLADNAVAVYDPADSSKNLLYPPPYARCYQRDRSVDVG